jgi:hypothetical protein
MSIENSTHQNPKANVHKQDWQDIGNYQRRALMDIAMNLGGGVTQERVRAVLIITADELLPTEAFEYLVSQYPEAGELVMDRTEEIQGIKHRDDEFRIRTFRRPRNSKHIISGELPLHSGIIARIVFNGKK